MKKLYLLLFMMAVWQAFAQPYNNEWIRFNQTYYKFKVTSEGLMRIPRATLDAAGLGNTPVQYFELWRNGEKVPFYPSTPGGPLPAGGYLEFWAVPNDGKPDRALYLDPAFQHTDRYSLMTDTAVYFLSVNNDESGIRYQNVINNVAGPKPPPEPYFLHTEGIYYKRRQNQGLAIDVKEYLYSSSYDKGEYWSSDEIYPATELTQTLNNLQVDKDGPDATFRFGISGNAANYRNVRVSLNGAVMQESAMNFFNDLHTAITLPVSSISAGSATVKFANLSTVGKDRMVVSYFDLTYPRKFDFGNSKSFAFKLPGKAAGYYLAIEHVDYGGTAPVLYDRALGERYTGDITTSPGLVLFVLPGTAITRDLVLANAEAGNWKPVNGLMEKKFTDLSQAAQQGDYLIISHPSLYTGSGASNPVNEYKQYRESAQGGGFNVLVADIDELVDQFAFGIKKHPLSVRNFIRYEREKFARPLKFVLLLGRGMNYVDYQKHLNDPIVDKLNIVPTFGYPASDNLLSAATTTSIYPETPIGRLSVVTGTEIEDYLAKVKEYDQVQLTASNTIADRAWMKNIVQVTGTNEAGLGQRLCNYMGYYKQKVEGSALGSNVWTFCKSLGNTSDQFVSDQIARLFSEGIGFLNYFGHSSATTLEFNLDNPQHYNNQGKYPVFFVNGCNAGNFFTFYRDRFNANETLSEKFVLAKQRGSIAFVASTHFGEVDKLHQFLVRLYEEIPAANGTGSLGETMRNVFRKWHEAYPADFVGRLHMEQITIHGDPALRLHTQAKADYVVEPSSIRIDPSFISVAETHFQAKIRFLNLGKAVTDSIRIEVKQQYPNGTTAVIFSNKIKGIAFSDSMALQVPIIATRDKGKHVLTVTVDAESAVDEIAEGNNVASREINIYEDEARPAFPYNLSIIKDPTQKLYATTSDPFSKPKDYILEIDTTASFNSTDKKSKVIASPGGVIEFDPQLTYKDSTVYYWRVSPVPSNGGNYQWFNHSFTYLKDVEGYSQSHYFQHEQSGLERMLLDPVTRTWNYGVRKNKIQVKNCIWGNTCNTEGELVVAVNEVDMIASACEGHSLVFHVFDPVTFKPWKNVDKDGIKLNRYGSGNAGCWPNRWYNFEFSYMEVGKRKLIMDFMDSIPMGAFVVVRSMDQDNPRSFSQTWRNDTLIYGSNNSLYHKLLEAGFLGIDSLYKSAAWGFVYKKGDLSFTPKWDVGKDENSRVNLTVDCYTPDTLGFIHSPVFGPAANWNRIEWSGRSLERPSADKPTIDVIGISQTFAETKLFTLRDSDHRFDISNLDAKLYPYMRLTMRNVDSINITPFQLDYWRVFYKPLPEGAMAANIFLQAKDTLETGEPFNFSIAFKNISRYDFDSVKVKVVVTDHNNVPHIISYSKQKALVSGDTLKLSLTVPTREYVGNNTLYVEVNPNQDQLEQYSFNNFLYRNFYVKADNTNPFLDVTFDGVHILNRDIVSAKPHIRVRLKDEAKHLLLNDSSLLYLQVKYPDGRVKVYEVDNDTLRFTPATSGQDNSAMLDFTPAFTKQFNHEGDEYELIVKGKDQSGNKAGAEYRVLFKVINKPMISNLLNYPNPFSTSTAFVFTLTGSEVPQQLKIQVLTVTGKIVREITTAELGPIHIGSNITAFKWDGTDQFGQKLANGVYLYRVVTSLNGRSLEKHHAEADNTGQFFTNGYGKMYLMR